MPRSRKYRLLLVVFLSIFSCSAVGVQAVRASDLENLPSFAFNLNNGWQVQSSCEAKAAGEQSMLNPSVDGTGDVQRRRKQGAPETRAVERRRIAEMRRTQNAETGMVIRRFAGARRATLGPGSTS